MENKKTNKKVLSIAIALIMLISLISLLCICGIENEKQSNKNFKLANLALENQPVEGEDISSEAVENNHQAVMSTFSATDNYSSYTNQELPDNIDKNNIAQYVPVDKFNSGEIIVYNGRNYGFIIVCQVGTNYVLLFREVYLPHTDGDGYDINLEVVYENNFYVTALGLIETNNGQHLGLADIKFNNFIIDADVDNFVANKDYDVQKDDGPYYIQSRYSSNFSYFNQELANEIVSFSTTALISIFAPAAGPAVKVAIDNLLDYAGTIMEVSSMSNSLVEDTFWLTDATLDTAIDFPLEREGQLETYDRLIKNLEIEMGAGSSEYITQNEKSPNFAKATFRVRNENDKDYYIYNNISFSLCRFIGGASYDLGAYSIESLYKSAVPEYNGSTKMLENEGKFQIVKGDVFAPMTKSNIFNFKPDESGYYKFIMPEGFDLVIDGIKQSDNRVYVDSNGCVVGALKNDVISNSSVYGKLVKDDFYNGQLDFANIKILKDQSLNLNANTTINDIVYTVVSSRYYNNDLFIADAGDYAANVDIYIADKDLNILSSATKVDGKLYVNYPMKPNEKYAVICVNRSGQPLDVTVNRESGMTLDNYPYKQVTGLYYSKLCEYDQYYYIKNAEVYLDSFKLQPIKGDNYYLEKDKMYFFKSIDTFPIDLDFSNIDMHLNYQFGEILECDSFSNKIVEFTPHVTALYIFNDGNYDVLGEEITLRNVNQAVLYKNQTYRIVKKEKSGIFQINFNEKVLQYGENELNGQSDYEVYTFRVEEEFRYDIKINELNSFEIYDEYFNYIDLDHGFLLKQGKYYIVVNNAGLGTINISEYLQEVEIILYVEGELYNLDNETKYFYGKPYVLPVPEVERKRFNGWRGENGLVTNNQGISYGKLLADTIVLEADFTWKNIIMQVNWIEGEPSKWWTGDSVVDEQPDSVYMEGDVVDLLINLRYDFMQLEDSNYDGHYFEEILYDRISGNDEYDYYIFTPNWLPEKYLIAYSLFNDPTKEYMATKALALGEQITAGIGLDAIFTNRDNAELYRAGWVISGKNLAPQIYDNYVIGDLTPNSQSVPDHDSDNDGVNDCVIVTIKELCEYVKYSVEINDVCYELAEYDNNIEDYYYLIEDLEYYNYNKENYLGRYVYLKIASEVSDDGAMQYKFGSDNIIRRDYLKKYWVNTNDTTADINKYNVLIKMSLIAEYIKVNIKYANGVTDLPEQDLIRTYTGPNDKNLVPGYVKGYAFNYWIFNGNRIDVLNYQNLNIGFGVKDIAEVTLQYNATRTNLKPTSLTDYEIKDTAVAIDCSRFSLMVGIEFVIHSSAKEITFLNGNCNDTNIVVKTRSSKLNIYFSNIAINAPNGKSVINALGCNDLELYSYNSVTLRGGEASINTSAPAILCKNLFLTGNNIYIYGGNSMNLYYNGRAGIKCEGSLTVNAKNVNVFGGNGSYIPDEEEIKEESEDDKNADFGPNSSYWNNKPQAEPGKDGKDGDSGIDGSHGAVAVYVVNNIKIGNGASLYCKGGDGGYGTDGKDGEKGGDGVDGKFGKYAVEAGDGGNGGPGGNGGNGGQSIYCANINEFIVKKESIHPRFSFDNGLGGKAGKNGHGAPPGKTSKTIFGNPTTPGVCGEGPESDELPSDGESGLSKIY